MTELYGTPLTSTITLYPLRFRVVVNFTAPLAEEVFVHVNDDLAFAIALIWIFAPGSEDSTAIS